MKYVDATGEFIPVVFDWERRETLKLLDWLKGRLKIQPHQLKGAPGIHDEQAAAEHVNDLVGALIDEQGAAHNLADVPAPTAGSTSALGSLAAEEREHAQNLGWK